ncbi:MAG: hypothetical protein IKJ35_03670 [Clostridia bacterium]|nr:hypothetical protein [Clostridia bacterium]
MKKLLCVLLVMLMTLTICSCGAKSLLDAREALESKGYYVTAASLSEFMPTDIEGKVLAAFDKDGIDKEQYSEWEDDIDEALYQTKNFVYAIYLESEQDAKELYPDIEEVCESCREYFEEMAEDELEAIADGVVFKDISCQMQGNVIYWGTKNAIKIAK